MRRLYLYGGLTQAFAATSVAFVEAAGGHGARIAVLCAPGGAGPGDLRRDPWTALGVAEVLPVVPAGDPPALDAEAMGSLRHCTGMFMGAGDTRAYHAAYTRPEVALLMRTRYLQGVPYAGLSSGALLAPEACILRGDRMTTPDNVCRLGGADGECDAELEVGDGLGLLLDCVTEVHFAERGGFPRLLAAMERSGVRHGLGLDESVCLEVEDERSVRVLGRGRAYVLTRLDAGVRVQPLEPGHRLRLGGV